MWVKVRWEVVGVGSIVCVYVGVSFLAGINLFV